MRGQTNLHGVLLDAEPVSPKSILPCLHGLRGRARLRSHAGCQRRGWYSAPPARPLSIVEAILVDERVYKRVSGRRIKREREDALMIARVPTTTSKHTTTVHELKAPVGWRRYAPPLSAASGRAIPLLPCPDGERQRQRKRPRRRRGPCSSRREWRRCAPPPGAACGRAVVPSLHVPPHPRVRQQPRRHGAHRRHRPATES